MTSVSPLTSTYLAPPQTHMAIRPAPKRLLSLQTSSRPSPYSTSRPLSSSSQGAQRPGAPKRSHSFCGDSSASTYALASTSAASHLSSDKRALIAPPLERTISSIGSRGNQSPTSQQMARPFSMTPTPMCTPSMEQNDPVYAYGEETSGRACLTETTRHNIPSPPRMSREGAVPKIMVHHSLTPPRPSINTIQMPSYGSSRSSSFSSPLPATPSGALLFGPPSSASAPGGLSSKDTYERDYDADSVNGVEDIIDDVTEAVVDMAVA